MRKEQILQEGYIAGLKKANQIIQKMLNERRGDTQYVSSVRDFPRECYAHLGNSPKKVLEELIEWNVFDMMSVDEAADWVSKMEYFDTLEDYNEACNDNLTEEEAMDGGINPHVFLLDDGSVVLA